jgi:hypothetical protein
MRHYEDMRQSSVTYTCALHSRLSLRDRRPTHVPALLKVIPSQNDTPVPATQHVPFPHGTKFLN